MDAMVMNFPPKEKRTAPLLDARKNKVYSCIYSLKGDEATRITDYLLVTMDELLEGLEDEVVFYGDAIAKYEENLKKHPLVRYDKDLDWYPRAREIGKIGLKRSAYMTDDPETIEPLYLHVKECNIARKKD
jgi:tRNA A37 threonylcarbamoyladenosine modification protein TsaB